MREFIGRKNVAVKKLVWKGENGEMEWAMKGGFIWPLSLIFLLV